MMPRVGRAPLAALLVLSLMLGACTAAQPPAADGRPALLTAPTPQCRAGIEQALGAALQAPVSLSPDAFITASTLLLEHGQPRDAAGRPRDGRSLGKPVRATLETDGRTCFLVTTAVAGRIALDACTCRAQATP
jgi:hypothetical protein